MSSSRKAPISEVDFIAEVVRRTGCGLLLDVNNVFVSFDEPRPGTPSAISTVIRWQMCKRSISPATIAQADETGGPLLIDTHDRPVDDVVWQLLRTRSTGSVPFRRSSNGTPMCPRGPNCLQKQSGPTRSSRQLPGDAMPPLHERLQEFADALFGPSVPAPPGLTRSDGRPLGTPVQRLPQQRGRGAYAEALSANYPATRRIVGEEFFAAMARAYVGRNPPRSPMMFDYGADFSNFVARFEPADWVPYLADVARLERAWLEAYHAADALTVGGRPARSVGCRASVEPAANIASFAADCQLKHLSDRNDMGHEYGDGEPGSAPRRRRACAGYSSRAQVQVIPIDTGTATLVGALAAGAKLCSKRARSALATPVSFDLAESLRLLLSAGVSPDTPRTKNSGPAIRQPEPVAMRFLLDPIERALALSVSRRARDRTADAARGARGAVPQIGPHQVGRLPANVAGGLVSCSRASSSCTSWALLMRCRFRIFWRPPMPWRRSRCLFF